MKIRRILTVSIAAALLVAPSSSAVAQDKKDQEKRSKQQQEDINALIQLVDKTSADPAGGGAAAEQRQGEVDIAWNANHFIKGQDGSTYIPFTISIARSALPSPDVALYVRAVNKQAAATSTTEKKDAKQGSDPAYPWNDAYFLKLDDGGRLDRAMALPGGEYDVFVAVKDQAAGDRKGPGKTGVLRHTLTVPDFKKPDLATSSVLLGSIESLPSAPSREEQRDHPYTFGSMRVTPSPDGKFSKAGELSLLFWIYGAGLDSATNKPSVTVEYNFYQRLQDGEKYFNKTAPQELNAQTLPPQFDLAAGHQLPGSLAVPLMVFPSGDYRVEITVTDKPSGKSVTQSVNFTVVG